MSTQSAGTDHRYQMVDQPVIAVGVDGSERNRSAIEWAREEALQVGGRLVLVGASHEYAPPTPRFSIDYADELFENETLKTLQRVRGELGATDGETPILIGAGAAREVLLRAAAQADVLVVGKRGLGAVKRMMVGSNSIAVAGRAPVPVVVVPAAWDAAARRTGPIVMGLDVARPDEALLRYAFERADRLGVPLVAVHAWLIPPAYAWSPDDLARWDADVSEAVSERLSPWIDQFPDVRVTTVTPAANAAMTVLDTAEDAQLVVLGRHTGRHHVGGFHLGSTARAVLHYAQCPVAVIPSKALEQS